MGEEAKLEVGKDLVTLAQASRNLAESSIGRQDWSGLPIPIPGLRLVLEPRYKHKAMENFSWKECYDENGVRHEIPQEPPPQASGFRRVNSWWSDRSQVTVIVSQDKQGRAGFSLDMICPHCKNVCKKYGFFGGGNRCQRYRCNSCAKTFSDIPYRPLGRLKTPLKKATRIVNLLVEGVGVRATARITKTHPNTIQAVLEVAGSKSAFLLDKMVREVNFPFVQVDEMFCFVGCKEKNNVTGDPERGRQSIFLGVDADSKFIINWMIGKRTSGTIEKYMQDLKLRVARPFQLSTDGYELFEDEVKWAFYGEAAYGQVSKKFIHPRAKDSNTAEGRYEPSRVKTIYKRQVFGPVRFDKISTSYIDRTHLNLRLFNRRLTRLTLGFSKKLEHLKNSVALSIAHYNFCRVHKSLQGETPAMAARLTDHVWSIAELLTESGQIGSEKWICPLLERTVSPPIKILKAA